MPWAGPFRVAEMVYIWSSVTIPLPFLLPIELSALRKVKMMRVVISGAVLPGDTVLDRMGQTSP